jgi:hypothetical protein
MDAAAIAEMFVRPPVNSATAFPTMAAVTFDAGPGRALALTLVSVATGHGDSPDPYPPKSITLI